MANVNPTKTNQKKTKPFHFSRFEQIRKRLHSIRKTVSAVFEMLLQNLFPRFSFNRFWKDLRRKPAFWAVVAAISALILFLVIKSILTSPPEEIAVVERGAISIDLIESGDVEAGSEKVVSAPETYVEQIQVIKLVPEGTMVKKGDFLVQFDAGDLGDQKVLAEAQLVSAQADYQKLMAQQTLALSTLQNNLKLNEYSHEQAKLQLEMQQFESEAKKEEARLQLKQAEINLQSMQEQLASMRIIHANQRISTESTIRQVRNKISQLKNQISRMQILAPEDGIVLYKEVGSWQSRERLKEGYKARHGEPVLSIPNMSSLQIKLYVNEADRSEVIQGQKAIISLDAYPKLVFHGKVQTVSRLAQYVRWNSKLKGFAVVVNVAEYDKRLKPGMSAKVRIILDSLKNVLTVPTGVVFEVDGKPAVFPRGKTKPVFVTLGPRNDERIVIDRGVKQGMKLSWYPVNPKIRMYGYAEEKRRIDLLAANLEKGLSLFEKNGKLYDYRNSNKSKRKIQDQSGGGGSEEMLRQFMRQRGPGAPSGAPEGSSDRNGSGSLQVTPQMLDRMQSRQRYRQGKDSTEIPQQMQRGKERQKRSNPQGQADAGSTDKGIAQPLPVSPEMPEQDRPMRQRRQYPESPGGSDRTLNGPGAFPQRGEGSQMTPEMMERIRQFRQRRGGDSTGAGGDRPFQMTPEMRERIRQWRQNRGSAPRDSVSGRQSPPRDMIPMENQGP